MGVNAAGVNNNLPTLKKALNEINPGVFFTQETKLRYQGKVKIDGYVIYEQVRSKKNNKPGQVGGGLIIGCKKELNPIWIRDWGDQTEAIDALRIIVSLAVCDSAHNTGGVTVKILSTEKY